jgi:hypothetical protein
MGWGPDSQFAPDSSLEETVSSELVSETRISG